MSLFLEDTPKEIQAKFLNLRQPQEVAEFLEIDYRKLILYLYGIRPEKRYVSFDVPKKSGQTRRISAPIKGLKIVQQKLAQALQIVYEERLKYPVHGFVSDCSILTNAKEHARSRFILNIDLEDFFPSINFGRVRGLFIWRYRFSPSVATLLAQICCHNNQLPQGAPTSPVISNMICAKLDKELTQLAKNQDCIYTRYADDITFSTTIPRIPYPLARPDSRDGYSRLRIGEELLNIIENNGFKLNAKKIRLHGRDERQIVTGLVVNRFPNVRRNYIRQIRAMLHAWEKYGLEAAAHEHHKLYASKYRGPYKDEAPLFQNVVRGKIAFLKMVRGKDDPIYIRYWNQLTALAPEFGNPIGLEVLKPLVFTEGKTDPKHLSAALLNLKKKGHYRNLELEFPPEHSGADSGDDSLLKMCQSFARIPQERRQIFIFDRDVPDRIRSKVEGNGGYRNWGNNVYSFLLPVPSHRKEDANSVCIELYYQDIDLQHQDQHGRRLFLNREFNVRSARHSKLDLICSDLEKLRKKGLAIIDSEVYDKNNDNVALAKSAFAENIQSNRPNFDNLDFSEFTKIFDLILQISKE